MLLVIESCVWPRPIEATNKTLTPLKANRKSDWLKEANQLPPRAFCTPKRRMQSGQFAQRDYIQGKLRQHGLHYSVVSGPESIRCGSGLLQNSEIQSRSSQPFNRNQFATHACLCKQRLSIRRIAQLSNLSRSTRKDPSAIYKLLDYTKWYDAPPSSPDRQKHVQIQRPNPNSHLTTQVLCVEYFTTAERRATFHSVVTVHFGSSEGSSSSISCEIAGAKMRMFRSQQISWSIGYYFLSSVSST